MDFDVVSARFEATVVDKKGRFNPVGQSALELSAEWSC
jgi:hypothetical protein